MITRVPREIARISLILLIRLAPGGHGKVIQRQTQSDQVEAVPLQGRTGGKRSPHCSTSSRPAVQRLCLPSLSGPEAASISAHRSGVEWWAFHCLQRVHGTRWSCDRRSGSSPPAPCLRRALHPGYDLVPRLPPSRSAIARGMFCPHRCRRVRERRLETLRADVFGKLFIPRRPITPFIRPTSQQDRILAADRDPGQTRGTWVCRSPAPAGRYEAQVGRLRPHERRQAIQHAITAPPSTWGRVASTHLAGAGHRFS
jgi:hypothetical protein